MKPKLTTYLLGILLSLCPVQLIFAENTPEQKSSAPDGVVTGVVVNEKTKEPVAFANISLMRQQDSAIVTGAITNEKGLFSIDKVPPGDYRVAVKFIGFKKQIVQNISISKKQKVAQLKPIALKPGNVQLDEVEVVEDRNYVDFKVDRKVINVSQHIESKGGRAVDVLKNAPSVAVDAEDNVTMRGSDSFTVLIDGKPTIFSGSEALKQIPASMIENIEIITNPSAKFDPDGVAGIINLVMKKEHREGVNGVLNLTAATGNKYNGDFTFNKRTKNFNWFGNVSGAYRNFPNSQEMKTEITSNNGDVENVVMNMEPERIMKTYSAKLGADYFLDDYNSFTLSVDGGYWGMDFLAPTKYHEFYTVGPATNDYILSDNETKMGGNYINSNISYQHKFNDKGHNLDVSAFVAYWDGKRDVTRASDTTNADFDNVIATGGKTRSSEDQGRTQMRYKVDYVWPVNEKSKLELGAQSRFNDEKSDFDAETFLANAWQNDPTQTNNMVFTRQIHGGYATWSGELFGLQYKLGLRSEYTYRNIEQGATNDEYTIDRLDMYPTIHLTKKIEKVGQFQLSATRRINRPPQWLLNPFPMFADNNTFQSGNPELEPEYINAAEINYSHNIKKTRFSIEGFYRLKENAFSRYAYYDSDLELMIIGFDNLNEEITMGAEVMVNTPITKWWRLYLSGSLYHFQIKDNSTVESDPSSVNGNVRMNNTFLLGKKTRIQLSGFYNSPTVTAQGDREGFFMATGAVSRDLWDKKASLTLQVRDMFNTMKMDFTSTGSNFETDGHFKGEGPVVQLTFTYRLNNFRKAMRQQDEQMDMGGGAGGGGGML
jgi:outer membrane receptor protein involved in Fe transport